MTEVISIPFKKRISGSSQRAKALYWLRCCYGKAFEDAIIDAVWIVYSATAFAAFPETWSQVVPTVLKTRKVFEEMMALASGAPGTEKPIPRRITVQFKKTLAPDSERGKTFQWLQNTFGARAVDEIMYAVWLVYFPAALASSPETSPKARCQAECSRLVFDLKMTKALSQTSSEVITTHRLDKACTGTLSLPPVDDLPLKAPFAEAQKEFPLAQDDSEQAQDFGDDYVPAEPDPDFM